MLFHIKLTKATKKKLKKLNPKKAQPTICRKTKNKQQTTYNIQTNKQTNKPVLDPTLIFPSVSLPLFVVLFDIVIKSC